VRRVWPEMLIGWSRLVAGRLRDPLVGRDVLLGVVAGVAAIWMPRLAVEVAGWLGRPGPLFGLGSPTQAPGYLPIGAREGLNFVVEQFGYATLIGVSLAVNLLALNWLLRSRIAAIIAVVGQLTTLFALTLTSSFPETPFPDVLFPVIAAPIIVLTLVRYGVLASIVMNAVGLMMNLIPVTFEGSVAYAGASRLIAVIVLGLAIFGFRTALAGRPVLGGRLLERQAS
jgi:hypothetical protein